MSVPVPQPPGLPLLGNVRDVDPQNALASLWHLADKYGEIFKLNIFGIERYFVSSVALVDEVCDEKRFHKDVSSALEEVRNGVGNGLFTAYHDEPAWGIAHRTLTPAFGPLKIQNMYDEMYDIATQLVSKWARIGPDQAIHVTEDYTRLTFDSIALCAMDKRFNSFYQDEMHPFVRAMTDFLLESGSRAKRTRLEKMWNKEADRKYARDIALMQSVAQEVMDNRRANPSDKQDLLNALLFGKDPKTGQRMSDDIIMNNMLTFLIAGHETTSGLLSFATYYLIKNPQAYQRAQAEIDEVVGQGPVTYQHMQKLPYIEAVLREALRLNPPAPFFGVTPNESSEPCILGGKYHIPQGVAINCIVTAAGRDTTVFGPDANEFKPERMYKEKFTKLPPNAFKPFGNGARGCIGRPFAWQEAILTLALVLQNFNLRAKDPSYELRIKQTLTVKPDNFLMYATLREGIDPIHLGKKMFAGTQDVKSSKKEAAPAVPLAGGKPMTILFGGNSGTCEGLSQKLALAAASHGFSATVKPMDAAVANLPLDQPVVVVTASYEGNPPDNAGGFMEWLKSQDASKFQKGQFAVFGCGHHDWVSTYQKIPKLVETLLTSKGGALVAPRGESDVAQGTVFDDFDSWMDEALWPALSPGDSQEAEIEGLDMELSAGVRASHLRHSVQQALVLKNEVITPDGVNPQKRHVEFKLPTSVTYQAGDYLALLPINNVTTLARVIKRFGLPWDAILKLKKGAHTTIPTEREIAVSSVLGAYVELSSPASKKNIAVLEKYAPDQATKDTLTSLSESKTQHSVLELLEACPSIEMPFSVYLSMLPPLRIRQYSISSSPLVDPTIARITFSVLDDQKGRLGVATNYLKSLEPGTTAQIAIKKSSALFHLPLDDSTPIIMACAGTGLAPFMGFLAERAEKVKANKSLKLGEAQIFIGCRHPDQDKLYGEQLAEWEAQGIVKVFHAFSRSPENSAGCKYVQDRLYAERKQVTKLFTAGAQAYLCGSGAVGKGIGSTVAKIHVENMTELGTPLTYDEALEWWQKLRNERYTVDVFD